MTSSGDRDDDRRYWERHAGNYDISLGPLGRPLRPMLQLVERAVVGRARVLEVAAGTGLVTPTLARVAEHVTATDYADAMVEKLQTRVRQSGAANVECRQADIYDLPFDDGSFDAVVAANVLHLVPDLPGALEAMQRMLAPGGILVAPTFCHDETRLSWWTSRILALTGFPGHRRFTAASLRVALEEAGLRVTNEACLPGLIPVGYVEGTFPPQT